MPSALDAFFFAFSCLSSENLEWRDAIDFTIARNIIFIDIQWISSKKKIRRQHTSRPSKWRKKVFVAAQHEMNTVNKIVINQIVLGTLLTKCVCVFQAICVRAHALNFRSLSIRKWLQHQQPQQTLYNHNNAKTAKIKMSPGNWMKHLPRKSHE